MCSIKRMLICICCLTSLSAFGVEPFLVPAIGDIDKSFSGLSTASGEEIVLTMPSGALLALKQDRTLLNDKFPFYPFGCYVSSSPLLYDYDKDGQLDIAFFSESPAGFAGFHIITSQTSNLFLIDKLDQIPVSRPIVVDILTNQFGPELLYIADSGSIDIVNLSTKIREKSISIPNEKAVFLTADCPPASAGATNIVFFTDKNRLFIYNPSSETTNFVQAFSHSPISAPVIGEFSGNSSRDTAFLLSNGEFVVVSKNHSIIKQQLEPGKWDGFAYGDFNQDGQCEFLVVSSSGQHCLLRIINGSFSLTTPSDTYPLLFSAGDRFLVSGNIGGIQSLLSSGDVGSLARFSVADGAPEYSRWGQFAHVSTLMVFDGTEQGDRYFSPNADGVKDFASLGFFRVYTGTIGQQYKIIDTLVIKKSNMIVRTIPARQGAGDQLGWAYFQWDGKTDTGLVCGEGCYDYTYTSTITAGGTGQYSINGKVFLDVTIPQVDFAFTETVFTSLSNVSGMKTNTIIESTILDNFDSVTVDVSFLDYKNEVSVNSITQTVLLRQPLSGAFSGRFSGMWNGTGHDKSLVNSGIYIYQARVTDLAGNTAKKILTASEKNQKGNYVVFNDAGISIPDAGIFASPTLFNPANVVQKTTTLSFDVQHRILEAVGSGLNDALYKTGLKITVQSSTGSLVRTLYDSDASGLLDLRMSRPGIHDGTRFSIVWDGIQNDLKVAQGGEYTFKVILTDAFGESVTKICPVTIDNPQPEIREIAQQPDGRYRITGKAVNRRGFSSYAMFYRKVGNSTWNRLPVPILQQSRNDLLYPESNVSYSHVDNGLLANWDVFGLQSGQYEIMVAVTGTGGVFSAQTNIGVNNPFSIRDFSVDTVVLSPNGDGVQDRVKIFALLPDASQCTLTIKDKNNTVVCSSISNLGSTNYPQQFMLAWNGMGVSGNPVTAGRYTVEAVFNNGTASVVRRTNITVIGTNDGQSGSGFTNVTLISPMAKNIDGSHKYTLGVPYTWHATARGIRTPKHGVEASLQAIGTQTIRRYPRATAIVEIGCVYNKIKVDRISWTLKMHIYGWLGGSVWRERTHTVDYTNSSGEHVGFLIEKNTSLTNNPQTDFYSVDSSSDMIPSQEKRFHMHYKASDLKDFFGPDSFGAINIINKKIESRNRFGETIDITDAFDWNIGLEITRVSAAKVLGDSFAAAAVAVGSYCAGEAVAGKVTESVAAIKVGAPLLAATIAQFTGDLSSNQELAKPDSAKQNRLMAFNAAVSIGCQFIPPPGGAAVAGIVSFIANFAVGDYSDELDLRIPIKLKAALSVQGVSEYGFSDFFMNDMAKQVSLSFKEGITTLTFPGVFSKFKKYEGILVESIRYTNIVFSSFSYIPLHTRTTINHSMIDISQGSCFTNEKADPLFWAIGYSSDTNGDPIVKIRNNFHFTDTIPWPLISHQQFYSYAPDGVYDECLSNASQHALHSISTYVSSDNPFIIQSIRSLSNEMFYLPQTVSNIQLFGTLRRVAIIDANSNSSPGLSSDVDPSLLQRVIPTVAFDGNDANFTLSTIYKEENIKLSPGVFGHIGFITNISASQTNSVFITGYYGDTCTSGWEKPYDTAFSTWEYALTTFNGSSHPTLKCISPVNSSDLIVASNSGVDSGLRKIYPIYGSANITGFVSYKLEYGLVEGMATQPTSWHIVPMPEQSGGTISRRAVINGIIGLFDVTALKEGRYRLLLTVEGTNTVGEPLVVQRLSDIIWYNEPIIISKVDIFCNDDSGYFDPEKGKLQITYHLSEPTTANGNGSGVVLRIRDAANNTVIREFQQSGVFGQNTLLWDGTDTSGARTLDGAYYLQILAYDNAGGSPCTYNSTNEGKYIQVKNTPLVVSSISATPTTIVPTGEVNKTAVHYTLSKKASASATIFISFFKSGTELVRVLTGSGLAGENQVVWDGKDAAGNPADPGSYDLQLSITGITNYRLTNYLTVQSPAVTDCIAYLENPDKDGKGNILGQSGNYIQWEASLSGQFSSNQLAHIALSAYGINYKEIESKIHLGIKLQMNQTNFLLRTKTISSKNSDNESSFSLSNSQMLRTTFDFKASNEDDNFYDDESYMWFWMGTNVIGQNHGIIFYAVKKCPGYEIDYEETITNNITLNTRTTCHYYSTDPIFKPGDYYLRLKTAYLDSNDHCNVTIHYREQQASKKENDFAVVTNLTLVYRSLNNNNGDWFFKINDLITNEIKIITYSPFYTNWSPNEPFTPLELDYFDPYLYSDQKTYPKVVSDIIAFESRAYGIDGTQRNLISTAAGENPDHKIYVSVIDSPTLYDVSKQKTYNTSRARVDFILTTKNITRSGVDYSWNQSGHSLLYLNAFNPITNVIKNAFTNINEIPTHVYFQWIKASNANPNDGIMVHFPLGNSGAMTTNTNDYLVIQSFNTNTWSTHALTQLDRGMLSSVMQNDPLPVTENDPPSRCYCAPSKGCTSSSFA